MHARHDFKQNTIIGSREAADYISLSEGKLCYAYVVVFYWTAVTYDCIELH